MQGGATDLFDSDRTLRQRRPLRRHAAPRVVTSLLLLPMFPQQQVERRHGDAVIDHQLEGGRRRDYNVRKSRKCPTLIMKEWGKVGQQFVQRWNFSSDVFSKDVRNRGRLFGEENKSNMNPQILVPAELNSSPSPRVHPRGET